MITHLEPDILEWEVKWALESITTNRASGSDGPKQKQMEVRDFVQETGIKTIPKKKKCKKAKWLSEEDLTNSCEKKGREKQKRKGKIYPFECRVPTNSKER